MSSRSANPRSVLGSRRQDAGAVDRIVDQPETRTALPAGKRRGRCQPQAEDFQVTFESPEPLLISEKELRAIEILLGNDLRDLLANGSGDFTDK